MCNEFMHSWMAHRFKKWAIKIPERYHLLDFDILIKIFSNLLGHSVAQHEEKMGR